MSEPSTATIQVVLYDGSRGGTPETQGHMRYRGSADASATQTVADGATILDTTLDQRDSAGYVPVPAILPHLDRVAGYALQFNVQVLTERHDDSDKNGDGVGDRAGFSVLLLSSDCRGIELGFWPDQAWAQESDAVEPPRGMLFTHAETARFDTTRDLIRYTLTIHGDTYDLSSDGMPILSGRLRDYTAFEGPVNPYRTPNFLFLGDDTASAQATISLAYVGVTLAAAG